MKRSNIHRRSRARFKKSIEDQGSAREMQCVEKSNCKQKKSIPPGPIATKDS